MGLKWYLIVLLWSGLLNQHWSKTDFANNQDFSPVVSLGERNLMDE